MSRSKCDSTSSSSWFEEDYRSGSQFRSKQQMPSVADINSSGIWDRSKADAIEPSKSSKLNKYSLVIVLPSGSDKNLNEELEVSNDNSVIQADSGVGSMSPSPPKTPTPDYDSLEDEVDFATTATTQSVSASIAIPKKVHFSISDDIDPPGPSLKSKSSWRDLLVDDELLDYQPDRLAYCYRQEWVHGDAKYSKTKSVSKHHLSTTILHDLEKISTRSSRSETRKRTGTKLVRRASSLDRFDGQKFLQKYQNRTPIFCDPDPLKKPIASRNKKPSTKSPKQYKNSESSSLKPVERASCGPGPPLKQIRSYSVESNSNYSPAQLGRARQRSVSGNVSSKKTPVRRVDDEALKRSRLHNSQYELSQDLLDKQVEMLERKYGGVCARKAALTIQRAFRKYTIMKRFQDIANASKGEKRLSRRFPTFDVENKEWVVYNSNGTISRYPHFQHHQTCYDGEVKLCNNFHANVNSDSIMQSHYNALYRELNETLDSEEASRYVKPCRTQSFRERRIKFQDAYGQAPYLSEYNNKESYEQYVGKQISHLNSAYYQDAYQSSTRSPPSFPRHPAWTAVPNVNNSQRTHCSPNQTTVFIHSSPSVKVQHQDNFQPMRDSVSSEDSALSSLSVEVETHEVDSSLHRGSLTRHSLQISPSKMATSSVLQRNATRASDVALSRRVSPRVEQKKVPPQVPKRTSSIPGREDGIESADVICEISQQSSCKATNNKTVEASPVWKRKSLVLAEQSITVEDKRLSNISENSEDSMDSGGGYSNTPPADMSHSFNVHNYPDVRTPRDLPGTPTIYKLTEIQRKRQYRVGLNLFNKKPERGIRYLIQRGFLEASPQAVARFLLTRKGLSKQMIGEYLGNLQNSFNMAVLECFVQELDLAGMQVDVALRKFQTFFRMPGEAQKIERLVEVFSHRYIDCNHDIASKFHNADTVFVLAFAIIMLNTDLHTPNMKAEKRMKIEEFIRNLRSIDDGHDLDRDMLVGIYERIKTNEFKMGSDHVTQVLKVQQTIVGKKPNLALPHRRLVCYCRLYEVYDVSKKERPGVHQREVFLFNDLLMVTKIFSKKKNSVSYTFRQSFPLCGMSVTLFEAPYYPHGIRLSQRVDDKVLITFNARNEHDRSKFVEDLKESILEMDEMENLRIEGELEKQKMMRVRGAENRDSGVADMEIIPQPSKDGKLSPESIASSNNLKRSALSNSLLDLHEQQINKPVRRGSAGSLDSGMSISFQSSAASSVSHDSSPQIVHASSTSSGSGSSLGSTRSGQDSGTTGSKQQQPIQAGFLGGLFGKKGKLVSKSNLRKPTDAADS